MGAVGTNHKSEWRLCVWQFVAAAGGAAGWGLPPSRGSTTLFECLRGSISHPEGACANDVNLTFMLRWFQNLCPWSCPQYRCWSLRWGRLHFGAVDLKRGYSLFPEHGSLQSRTIVASEVASEQASCLNHLGLFTEAAIFLCFSPHEAQHTCIKCLLLCSWLISIVLYLLKYTSRVW